VRILQIIPGADSFRVFLAELTQALIDEGHEVLTLFNPGGGISNQCVEGPGEIRHVNFPRGASPLRHFITGCEVRGIIKDFQPDVVHAHFSSAILTASIARLGGNCGARWFATFQGIQFPFVSGMKGQLICASETFAASQMDQVYVLTEDDQLALSDGAPSAEVCLQKSLGFGCHDRFFDTPFPDSEARLAFRETLELSAGDRVFIFIGRMVAHKGFHLAARAFMKAAESCSDLRWIVIGERDPIHPTGLGDEEWTAFEHHPSIRFLGVQDDVLPYLDAADAMLFPTSREGMPVSVMEALARRVPVLTNKVRGCRELIEPGVNGAFFEASTVAAIQTVIEAFAPMNQAIPNEGMRRSNWIRETIELYQSRTSV
jgi:glycosyltransferase involved in cell wall biosynthesis